MQIRKLTDAVIVAALLLTSMPELTSEITPEALLNPPSLTAAADVPEDPAPRKPSIYT